MWRLDVGSVGDDELRVGFCGGVGGWNRCLGAI